MLVSMMNVTMMYASMICVVCTHVANIYDLWSWCMYVWCIYRWSLIFNPWSLILMHVCMMHVSIVYASIILDIWSCMYDACMNDTYICDPRSLTLIHVSMMYISVMRLKFGYGRTDRRANKAILGVGRENKSIYSKMAGWTIHFCHDIRQNTVKLQSNLSTETMHYWLRPFEGVQFRFDNLGSHFIRLQIFQIDLSTLLLILSASR